MYLQAGVPDTRVLLLLLTGKKFFLASSVVTGAGAKFQTGKFDARTVRRVSTCLYCTGTCAELVLACWPAALLS